MFTKIFVLYAGLVFSVVAANPLLQALVSQSCPICEQNSLKSQIKNLLLQSIQPCSQVYFNPSPPESVQPVLPIEPPCSFCPTQNRQNQNFQGPFQQQAVNQPYCPQSQTVQLQNNQNVPEAVNKLLSNPNLRNILDPNTKLFNQNGVEVPRNGPHNTGTPNVVNNYIIIPPQFLLEDIINNTKTDKKAPEQRGVRNRTNNSSKRTIEEKRESNSEVAVDDNTGINENLSNNGTRKQRRRPRNKKPDIRVRVVQENITQESNQIEPPRIIEQTKTQKEQDTRMPSENFDNKTAITITTPSVLTNKMEVEKEIDGSKNNPMEPNQSPVNKNVTIFQEQTQVTPIEKRISQQDDIQVKNLKETATVKSDNHKNKSKPKTKISAPKKLNPRDEAVIKDFRQKFPNIPEKVVRNLLEHMKKQFRHQNFDAPAFYYPQFPITYDQLFRNQFPQTPSIVISTQGKKSNSRAQKSVAESKNNDANRSTKRKKNRRNKNQQEAPNEPSIPATCTTTEFTPITVLEKLDNGYIDTTTVPTTTTKMPPAIETATEILDIAIVAEVNKPTANIETITSKISEESILSKNLGKNNEIDVKNLQSHSEDVVPRVFTHELVDEYYPDFTSDHQYSSNEDFSFIILEDDRFHYTTDKNVELEELNRERRRFDLNSKRPEGRYILRVKNKDIPRTITRQRITENTSSRSGLNRHIEIPKIVFKIQSKDTDIDKDFVEDAIKKPITLSDKEEIQFRTPPSLEKIDFETKQVNKKQNSYDDFETKTSSYSDFKTPQYNFSKYNDKSKNVDKPNPLVDQIETVYANSKVATYGKPSSSNEVSTEKDIWMDIDNEYSRIENDGRKVVFAKTIDGDFW